MKKSILIFSLAVAMISVKAQSLAFSEAKPVANEAAYDNSSATTDNTADVKPMKQTYQVTYDEHYNPLTGGVYNTELLVKNRVSTRVVYLPECLQSYLYTKYGASKWKHATNVTTADNSKYYEVQVGGKELRFDDICNLSMEQPLTGEVLSARKVK